MAAVGSCEPPEDVSGSKLAHRQEPPHAEPKVRGERLWRSIDNFFVRLDRITTTLIPDAYNPLVNTGAIANVCLAVAVISGVLLLFWYESSVREAYASVMLMQRAPYTAGLLRSLHRYSSDACMFFALVHGLRLFAARRFAGARWLAWVTGITLVGVLWLVGWTGYWLVWDQRAQLIATSTARLFDGVPIFADSFSRSFLTDDGVSSLLFFVVFFVHMLVPLALGVLVWLHIVRLARPRFFTSRAMALWVVVMLVVAALFFPAQAAGPAHLLAPPERLTLDLWYLAPLALAERLGVGAQWSLLLFASAILLVPWLLTKRRAEVAEVIASRCDGCRQCANDCPYNAINMVPHPDSGRASECASVEPNRCVGCGICAGSCNRAGIGLAWFEALGERRRIETWLQNVSFDDAAGGLVLACVEAWPKEIEVDAQQGTCSALPGFRVLHVPCSGWVNAVMLERAARRGARRILLASCAPGQCRFREGPSLASERLAGQREPAPRRERLGEALVERVAVERSAKKLLRAARRLRGNDDRPAYRRLGAGVAGAVLAGALAVATTAFADVAVTLVMRPSELVVSFKHPGAVGESCRQRSPEELAKLPVHMRQARVCDRRRHDVRLRVVIDGRTVLDKAYSPRGLWSDGNSMALETLPLGTGEHNIEIALDDDGKPPWAFTDAHVLHVAAKQRHVVTFDRLTGFIWH